MPDEVKKKKKSLINTGVATMTGPIESEKQKTDRKAWKKKIAEQDQEEFYNQIRAENAKEAVKKKEAEEAAAAEAKKTFIKRMQNGKKKVKKKKEKEQKTLFTKQVDKFFEGENVNLKGEK